MQSSSCNGVPMKSIHIVYLFVLMPTLWLLVACQSDSASRRTGTVVVRSFERVPLPGGLNPDQFSPMDPEELARSNRNLHAIVDSLARPDFLEVYYNADRLSHPAEPQLLAEPPLAAQRAYIAGRQSWREGKNFEAVRQLQVALRLAPNQQEILRLLGRIYTSAGNKVRGAVYLKQAVTLDPTDIESLFLLGRFSLEQGRWEDAIAAFYVAMDQLEGALDIADTAYRPLIHYYLGAALQQSGYVRAAIEQYGAYLNVPRSFSFSTRIARELLFIDRQQSMVWQSIGDLYHRLDDPVSALEAYTRAAEWEVSDEMALLNRRVYTHLRLGQDKQAQHLVIERIGKSTGDQDSMLVLVRYLIDQGYSTQYMVDMLMAVYSEDQSSVQLAMMLSDLLPPSRGRAFLLTHLQSYPHHHEIYDHLLRRYLLPDGASRSDRQSLEDAAVITSELMAKNSTRASEYAAALIKRAGDREVLLDALRMIHEDKPDSMKSALYGLVLIEQFRLDEAAAVFESILLGDPDLILARVGLAKIMVANQDYERAVRILEPLADSRDNSVIELRVRVLAATGQFEEALSLLNSILDMDTSPTSLLIEKAAMHLQLGDATLAERTLLDALEKHPLDEGIYTALFEFYDSSHAGPDAVRQYQRLMQRVLNMIPQSRIARLKLAEVHMVQGQYEKSEALLLELLEENDQDIPVLSQLLEVYRGSSNREKELDVTERLLLLEPPSTRRVWALALVYRETSRLDKAVDVLKDALDAGSDKVEDPILLVRLLWLIMLDMDRGVEAEQELALIIERFPDHAANLWYELAVLIDRCGDKARSEATLIELLERYPDHALANNNLGYIWTVQHKHLEKAMAMIEKAVDKEPHNAAYLDSLGWVYYKLGKFEDAEVRLRQSRNENGGEYPVIVDHLGDTLYRLGRDEEALRAWESAQAMFERELPDDDPDLEGLDERLQDKIASLKAGGPVPVADIAIEVSQDIEVGVHEDKEVMDQALPVESEMAEQEAGVDAQQ